MKDVQTLVDAVTKFLHHWDSNHLLKTATAAEAMRKAVEDLNLSTLKWNELALKDWLDKTEWVQQTVQPGELGMHRADVLHARIRKEASLNRKAYMAGIEEGKKQDGAWRQAVIDQLVVHHIYTKAHEEDARKAMNDLLIISNAIALDRKVSSYAQTLYDEGVAAGKAEMQKATSCNEHNYGKHGNA